MDLDVNNKSEVALLGNTALEDRIKDALNTKRSLLSTESTMDRTLLSFSDLCTSKWISPVEANYICHHLEAALCLSAAAHSCNNMNIDNLLTFCGIPFIGTEDEKKALLKRKLHLMKGSPISERTSHVNPVKGAS